MLAVGTGTTVSTKLQDEIVVSTHADGTKQKFNHPYFQCAIMFFGEFTVLGMYVVKKYLYPDTESSN